MQASPSPQVPRHVLSRKFYTWVALTGFAFLFVAGFIGYPGSKLVYLAFTVSFSALLLSAIYKPSSFSYLFLAIFLWLGFWFKLTANYFLLGYFPYGEPIGQFDESALAWDRALWIAIVASTALMLTEALYKFTGLGSTLMTAGRGVAPAWYPRIRRWLWASLVIGLIGLSVLNARYGIQQSGLVPRTLLPWPLNAVIYWMLSTGFSMAVATLLWWDNCLQKNLLLPVCAVLGEAFFSTVSLLSRSVYIFHAIPPLLALFINRHSLFLMAMKHYVVIASAFFILFSGSIIAVSYSRDFFYDSGSSSSVSTAPPPQSSLVKPSAKPPVSSVRLILLHQLIVNRWIGIEGVLAVSSYSERSPALFFRELMARSTIGKVDAYQKISNSSYQEIDGSKYQFSSLPGATAFFYYSGSIWYVFAGMMLLTFLAICGERLVFGMTGNILLCALYGANLANAIAQLGVTPRQLGPHFGMIAGAVVLIWIVQSSAFTRFVAHPWWRKS